MSSISRGLVGIQVRNFIMNMNGFLDLFQNFVKLDIINLI